MITVMGLKLYSYLILVISGIFFYHGIDIAQNCMSGRLIAM